MIETLLDKMGPIDSALSEEIDILVNGDEGEESEDDEELSEEDEESEKEERAEENEKTGKQKSKDAKPAKGHIDFEVHYDDLRLLIASRKAKARAVKRMTKRRRHSSEYRRRDPSILCWRL